MKRSLLVQTLLDMATGSGGAKLEALVVDAAGTFDAGRGKGYNPVTVPSGSINVLGEKGSVSNNSVIVTPKAQVVGGWLNSGETSGSGVGVTASELVSGTLNVSSAGETDVTNYQKVNVNSGSATPSANKGTVSNHVVQVTPIVTKVAGIITSGSESGTPISVTASELVSGTLNVSSDGVQDVTNYQNISVPSGGHSASAHKGTVSNHSIIVTPRSTATQGFVQAGTVEGVGVSVSASELVSGNLAITSNGTYNVENYAQCSVNLNFTRTTAAVNVTGSNLESLTLNELSGASFFSIMAMTDFTMNGLIATGIVLFNTVSTQQVNIYRKTNAQAIEETWQFDVYPHINRVDIHSGGFMNPNLLYRFWIYK